VKNFIGQYVRLVDGRLATVRLMLNGLLSVRTVWGGGIHVHGLYPDKVESAELVHLKQLPRSVYAVCGEVLDFREAFLADSERQSFESRPGWERCADCAEGKANMGYGPRPVAPRPDPTKDAPEERRTPGASGRADTRS